MAEQREEYQGRTIVWDEDGPTPRLEIDGKALEIEGRARRYSSPLLFAFFESPLEIAKKLIDRRIV